MLLAKQAEVVAYFCCWHSVTAWLFLTQTFNYLLHNLMSSSKVWLAVGQYHLFEKVKALFFIFIMLTLWERSRWNLPALLVLNLIKL